MLRRQTSWTDNAAPQMRANRGAHGNPTVHLHFHQGDGQAVVTICSEREVAESDTLLIPHIIKYNSLRGFSVKVLVTK